MGKRVEKVQNLYDKVIKELDLDNEDTNSFLLLNMAYDIAAIADAVAGDQVEVEGSGLREEFVKHLEDCKQAALDDFDEWLKTVKPGESYYFKGKTFEVREEDDG